MTRGKLLNYIDGEIVIARKELSNATALYEIKYWEDTEKELKQIRSILNLYFSISEEERKEAVEWAKEKLNINMSYHGRFPDKALEDETQIYKIILKSLGESSG